MSLIPEQKNQIIIKPFIYGSVAIALSKKCKEYATHKWCCYVRGVNNENISNFIKSVEFTLHDSFPNNVRLIKKWPFELYETGWGEFDIKIKIELIDDKAKPIHLIHSLKFYHDSIHQTHQPQQNKKAVVSENYDEVIFVNPKPEILEQIKDESYNNNKSVGPGIFQEPFLSKQSKEIETAVIENNGGENNNNTTSMMEVEYEDKSQINSQGGLTSNNNLENINKTNNNEKDKEKVNSMIISNVSQYFQKFDDSNIVKEIEDINAKVVESIERLKKELNEKEKEIMKLNKEIKNLK